MNYNMYSFSKKQKIIVVSLLLSIIILLFAIVLKTTLFTKNSRTVMIYIVGSNLETDAGIVTADLEAIIPQNINLDRTNILLYTGGTEEWHNFISNEDNGIYLLRSNGFEKLESQKKFNLGDPEILSNFLKYGFENYKADTYDLILYNHGGALDGAIYDDFTGDNLSISDLSKALQDSPFNEENKLETVLFRTCLNGTIELANTFKDYANYLIGSEEVSYGSKYTNVLGFLNDIELQDNGLQYGKKFIQSYDEQMKFLNPENAIVQTYSIIDLSKIARLNKELDEYISSIDLTKSYNDIVKIRSNLYQYGLESTNYDMIDLYDFIIQTKDYASENNSKLINTIDDTILYNNTNSSTSHGLSIYFPYKGTEGIKNKFLNVYENLNYSEEYKKFIKQFNSMQTSPSEYKFDISTNEVKTGHDKNEVSIKLTDEQMNNYASATFTIFEKDFEHPNYYKPLFNTSDVKLDNDGVLTVNFKNKLVKIKVESENNYEYHYMLTYYRKNTNTRTAQGILYDQDLDFSDKGYMNSVTFYITDNNKGEPVLSTAKLISNNERIDGILLKLKNYESFELWQTSRRILDDSGNVLDTSKWESAPVSYGFDGKIDEIEMKYSSLDSGDNYYGLFIITDVNGKSNYSKLIKIGE